MQIEFNGDVYDVNVTSSNDYREKTFESEAEGGEIEYEITLCDDSTKTLNFDEDQLKEIDRLIRSEAEEEAKYNNDEYLSEMAADRNDFY